jgi:hypothetical protein
MPDPNLSTPFDITPSDLKPSVLAQSANAFTLRGEPVMLAPDVALIFQVETREIIQNITRNSDIFPDRYAFELTPQEVAGLRSAGVISKPGRGGSRALPWAITRKGTLRLATLMKTPRAIQATDIFIDVFDEVLRQLQAGRGELTITNPSRLVETEADRSMIANLRQQLSDAVSGLLNTVVDAKAKTTLADELRNVSAEAVGHLKAWLQTNSVANEKIRAETLLILEQAQDIFERRQADMADREIERVFKRIEAVKAVMALYHDLEPSALVDLTRSFAAPLSAPQLALPPKKDRA